MSPTRAAKLIGFTDLDTVNDRARLRQLRDLAVRSLDRMAVDCPLRFKVATQVYIARASAKLGR